MILDPQDLNYLYYLAEELEEGNDFDRDARAFIDLTASLKNQVYRATNSSSVIRLLNQLPTIELQPYRRSFLEQMLPKGGRSMVGKYKARTIIRQQVQKTVRIFQELERWN